MYNKQTNEPLSTISKFKFSKAMKKQRPDQQQKKKRKTCNIDSTNGSATFCSLTARRVYLHLYKKCSGTRKLLLYSAIVTNTI